MNRISTKKRQLGQGMTEYIIIVALIAVAAIGVYSFFGQAIRSQMAGMTNELAGKSGTTNVNKAAEAAGKADSSTEAKNLGNYTGSQK
jgi:Flp pilus assembly pilin Flp